MNDKNVMRVIESKRLSRKLHKAKLCSAADISPQYYNRLLEGSSSPSFYIVSSLLTALGCKLAVVDAELGFV